MSILSWFSRTKELPLPSTTIAETIVEELVTEEFVSFPCVCGKNVAVRSRLMPGDAAVLNCDNCEVSWTVYSPSLIIRQTKEIPEHLQKQVWGELSQ
jgi:hypothetical protein